MRHKIQNFLTLACVWAHTAHSVSTPMAGLLILICSVVTLFSGEYEVEGTMHYHSQMYVTCINIRT